MEHRDGIREEPRSGGFESRFDFLPGELVCRETISGEEESLTASLEEIQKMDAVLKVKVTEEKRAKLSRIQAEEETRDLLSRLPRTEMPDRIKTNLEKFMRLLNEVETTEGDSAPGFKLNEGDGIGGAEPNDEEKGGKASRRQQNTSGLPFVERNIRLAKCGRGTLSLTDEEKSRIENLLADIGDPTAKLSMETTSFTEDEETYAIDCETKSVLSEIDRRLEVVDVLTKLNILNDSGGTEKSGNGEGKVSEEKENRGRGRKRGKKKGNRLEEINKLLNSMSLASSEEIHPLSEEEIESLIRRSKEGLNRQEDECPSPKPSPEVITELVSNAKLLMPNFRYRFEDV